MLIAQSLYDDCINGTSAGVFHLRYYSTDFTQIWYGGHLC